MTYIIFSRKDALQVLRYTSLDLIKVGDLWIEARAHDSDIATFELNGWYYRKG